MNDPSPKRSKSPWRESVEAVILAVGICLVTRAAVAEPRYIPSESMLPTLQVWDRLVVEKISGRLSLPARGDIVVFYPPFAKSSHSGLMGKTLDSIGLSGRDAYIKRVIGLPGETIAVRNGVVYINERPLDAEPYVEEPAYYEMAAVTIPAGHVFVLGDNRNHSYDSHSWGPLPIGQIVGRAALRFWPPERIGVLNPPR